MRTARLLTVFSILLVLFVASASAQRTRRPARRPAPKPTPTPVRPIVTADITAAKQQVANQLHNVNVFVDIFGPVAVGIESRDKSARSLDKKGLETLDLDKRKVIAAIRGLRDGLVALETDFRTKPSLSQYLPRIQGIGTLSTQSEDNAIAGRFVAAKEPLRQIALKLNETLAVLPGPMPIGTSPVRTTPASTQTRPVSTAPTQNRPVVTVPQNTSTGKSAPALGMTANEVLQSAWGAPTGKRTNQSKTTEVWTYSGNRTVYFYNGKVSNIVQ